jgi:hypothetical protein
MRLRPGRGGLLGELAPVLPHPNPKQGCAVAAGAPALIIKNNVEIMRVATEMARSVCVR